MSNEYAETIIRQMGGYGKLRSMVKARQFVGYKDERGVKFKFSGCGHANLVKITTNAKDLYDVEFYKVRKFDFDLVAERNDVYSEKLREVFEDYTGLALSL